MDFIEMQRQLLVDGTLDEKDLRAYTEATAVLTFIQGEAAVYQHHNGCAVYPEAGTTITPGAWIVHLRRSKQTYLATPVHRISPAYLHELLESQRGPIIDALWRDHRDDIMPYFEQKFSDEMEDSIRRAVQETEHANEDRVRLLEAELKAMREKSVMDEATIITLRGLLEETGNRGGQPQAAPGEDDTVPIGSPQAGKVRVVRKDGKILESPYFTAPKYFAHVSKDLSILVIREHEFGSAIAFDNKLYLSGLETICQFSGECEMDAHYDPVRDGLVIKLRRSRMLRWRGTSRSELASGGPHRRE